MDRFYAPETYARAEADDATALAERLETYSRRVALRAEAAASGTVSLSHRRALDIGCGDGRFLAALQARGWEALGLETDPVAAELARRRTGAAILEQAVEKASIEAGSVQLVTLLHVLEHVADPRTVLAAARRSLSAGGGLFIAVPNIASLEAAAFRSVWYSLDLPRHYWGFTPHTLTRLVEECGFHVKEIRHLPLIFTPQNLRNGVTALKGRRVERPSGSARRREGGGLRTKAFVALLELSERLGGSFPGEVMELTATTERGA
jgi:SAM-dependent methyltransferase